MTIVYYDPAMKVRQARSQYFEVNQFGADGGYGDKWADFKLGPVPFPFPNTAGRIRAVKVHDLHHIVTGYDTNTTGEFEISAWEIGAGCGDFYAAWFLNFGGMAGGAMVAPIRTFKAFRRGRSARSLYGRDLEAMLEQTVEDIRRETRVDQPVPAATVTDVLGFAAAVAAGLVFGSLFMAVGVVLAPIALMAGVVRSKQAASASAPAAE
jgi:hypothetical protein